jgi:hypothetical protein
VWARWWGNGDAVGENRALYFFSIRYASGMDTERSKELWDRLENEPERAYRAFECFLSLHSDERTVVEAYRSHVGNPEAVKSSDTWSGWSSEFAWRERAAAYDEHLAGLRREAYERGIEEEAERQGALDERNRNRMNELMTLGYEEAIRWFEEVGYEGMRASDVIQIMKLHLDATKAFEVDKEPIDRDTWSEEDDEFVETILKEMEAEEDLEGDSEESSSEESEDGQD